MKRKAFVKLAGLSIPLFLLDNRLMSTEAASEPETFFFKDDGSIPNSKLPLLLYRNAFAERGTRGAEWLEHRFESNNWTNNWRWGVYPFHHYHSNTHEVLGVFSGSALLHMGGENGRQLTVKAGDIIVIPAGVGHKCISHSDDFTVVGAYPDGLRPDLMRGEADERPKADQNIAAVNIPSADPLTGNKEGLLKKWSKKF